MQAIDHRRALHQIPELAFDLPQTLGYIEGVLKELPCRLFSPAKSSLCAFFDFGKDHAIAFRADMDALPIPEETELPFSSCHPGKAHACGHDGHMAIGLALAQWLGTQTGLPQNVLLVFQPAEETIGGAKGICQSGVFAAYNVKAIFGLHLWPDLPVGTVATCPGGMMCQSSEVTLTVTGKSAHVARAEEGLDGLEAANLWFMGAMEAERTLPTDRPRLLKFGRMEGGTVRNALASTARVEGTLRAFEDETFGMLRDRLYALAREVEEQTGCRLELHMTESYPAVWNHEELAELVLTHLPVERLESPVRIAEDFSWYQRYVPGVFFFLGCGPCPALHSRNFNFDEKALDTGISLFRAIAEDYYKWK